MDRSLVRASLSKAGTASSCAAAPIDKTFKRDQYSPDPSEPSRSWLPGLRDWRTMWESGVDWALGRFEEWLARKAGKQ
jgi:hypothetical protein